MDLSSFSKIDRKLRTAKRYQEIMSVLASYGFREFVVSSGLARWVKKEFGIELAPRAAAENKSLSREHRARMVVEALGPTFIKVGQILSTRPDLIPPSVADEFKKLQADVQTVSFTEVDSLLSAEYPDGVDAVFQEIQETPLASASLAQAHAAKLLDGTEVVLKVLKPGVRELIDADIGVISGLASFLERNSTSLGFNPTEVAKEFSRQLERETDFMHEGRSTEQLRKCFSDNPRVLFPKAYLEQSTRNVLVLERIHGKLLAHLDAETLSPEDRRTIVQNGADAVFRQCFELGIFHADPHPGNLMILDDNRICFLDCGMTGRLDQRTSQQLAMLVAGVVHSDLDRVVAVILALTDADRALAESRAFRNQAWEFIGHFQNTNLDSLDIGRLLDQFFSLLRENQVSCPGDLVLLIKAVSTIEGVAEQLDPTFDVVGYVRPYIEGFVKRQFGAKALGERFQRALRDYALLLEAFPESARIFVERMRKSKFPIKMEHRGLNELTSQLHSTSNAISLALLTSALLVGSAILILADRVAGQEGIVGTLGFGGFITAVVMAGILLFNNTFRK